MAVIGLYNAILMPNLSLIARIPVRRAALIFALIMQMRGLIFYLILK